MAASGDCRLRDLAGDKKSQRGSYQANQPDDLRNETASVTTFEGAGRVLQAKRVCCCNARGGRARKLLNKVGRIRGYQVGTTATIPGESTSTPSESSGKRGRPPRLDAVGDHWCLQSATYLAALAVAVDVPAALAAPSRTTHSIAGRRCGACSFHFVRYTKSQNPKIHRGTGQ